MTQLPVQVNNIVNKPNYVISLNTNRNLMDKECFSLDDSTG